MLFSQRELTQVVCEDSGGNVFHYILGKVLPGQRNGSQMWHESFSSFLRADLKIVECAAYPCLLRSETENQGQHACFFCMLKMFFVCAALLP